jgi:hypothetical protein
MRYIAPKRLDEAKAIIRGLLEPAGCLQVVFHSVMERRGFSRDEVSAGLQEVAALRPIYLKRFQHPKLQSHWYYTFKLR